MGILIIMRLLQVSFQHERVFFAYSCHTLRIFLKDSLFYHIAIKHILTNFIAHASPELLFSCWLQLFTIFRLLRGQSIVNVCSD